MQGGEKIQPSATHRLSASPCPRLIAGARIPLTVTSDRNSTVSPGTNHSSGGGSPSPDVPPAAGWRRGPRDPLATPSSPAPDLLRVPARREPEPGTDAGGDAPARDGAPRARHPSSGPRGSQEPPPSRIPAARGPRPPARPTRRRRPRPRPDARGEEGGARAAEALTLAAAALADILSLPSAARGSSDPKLRATSPPAPHATARINISRERAGLGAGAAGQARPTGRGLNSDKSPGNARPPRPGLLRGARPAGASLRVRPPARPPEALAARPRRPRPLAPRQHRGFRPSPQRARWPLRSRLPHLTSLEPAPGQGRGGGGLSRRRQLRAATQTCRPGPLSMPGRGAGPRRGGASGGGGASGRDPLPFGGPRSVAEGKARFPK